MEGTFNDWLFMVDEVVVTEERSAAFQQSLHLLFDIIRQAPVQQHQ